MSRLHVVVVHHDQPERCAATVAALEAQGPGVTVSVVDSGSSPPNAARLGDLLPATAILDAGGNVGFGAAANLGWRAWLKEGQGAWVAVAPHDALPRPGCIDRLLAEVAERHDVGLVSAEFGPAFDLVPAVDWVLGAFCQPGGRGEGWQDTDYAHGTLLLARRRVLEEVGLFDERYFAYCEEVDLSLRARAAGWRVGVVWGAVVDNAVLPSPPLANYLQTRNNLLLVRSHFGRYAASIQLLVALARTASRIRAEPEQWRLHLEVDLRAIADFLRQRFGPPPAAIWRRTRPQ